MSINKRRLGVLAGSIGSVGALAALSLGGTSALFTSEADGQNNVIEAGTIALTENETAGVELNETGFMPGDTKTSKYVLSYAGQDAFVGFDITLTSTAQTACAGLTAGPVSTATLMATCTETGTVPMFNGDGSSGSMDLVVDHVTGVMSSTLFGPGSFTGAAVSCSADATGLVTCTASKDNVILPPRAISLPTDDDLVWNNGMSTPVGVKVSLPLGAGNVFQGSDVHIDLQGHAVQYANNFATWGAGADPTTTRPGTATHADLRFPKSWS